MPWQDLYVVGNSHCQFPTVGKVLCTVQRPQCQRGQCDRCKNARSKKCEKTRCSKGASPSTQLAEQALLHGGSHVIARLLCDPLDADACVAGYSIAKRNAMAIDWSSDGTKNDPVWILRQQPFNGGLEPGAMKFHSADLVDDNEASAVAAGRRRAECRQCQRLETCNVDRK